MNKETIDKINDLSKKIAETESKLDAYIGDLCKEIVKNFDFSDSFMSDRYQKEYIDGISIIQTTDGLCFVDEDGLNVPVDDIFNMLQNECDKISYMDFRSCSI